MSELADLLHGMAEQLDLLVDALEQRPTERVRAALLNTAPTAVHAGDPSTAWTASVAAALRAPSVRQRVLLALADSGPYGCTDFELSERLGVLRTSAGKRRKELVDVGLVVISGLRRPTDTNVPAAVWTVTDLGRQVAHQLMEEGGS